MKEEKRELTTEEEKKVAGGLGEINPDYDDCEGMGYLTCKDCKHKRECEKTPFKHTGF